MKNILWLLMSVIVLLFFSCEDKGSSKKSGYDTTGDLTITNITFSGYEDVTETPLIDSEESTIAVIVTSDRVDATVLKPVVAHTGFRLLINGTTYDTESSYDFSQSAAVTVVGDDNVSTRDWTVTVTVNGTSAEDSTNSDGDDSTEGPTSALSDIVINEVKVGDSESAGNEFIELYNPNSTAILLDSSASDENYLLYRLTNGSSTPNLVFDFEGTGLKISAGGYVYVGAGTYSDGEGSYTAELSGTGGHILLYKGGASGTLIDEMCYDITNAWDNRSNISWEIDGTNIGDGSFIRDCTSSDTNQVTDWQITSTVTPGAINQADPPSLTLSSITIDPTSAALGESVTIDAQIALTGIAEVTEVLISISGNGVSLSDEIMESQGGDLYRYTIDTSSGTYAESETYTVAVSVSGSYSTSDSNTSYFKIIATRDNSWDCEDQSYPVDWSGTGDFSTSTPLSNSTYSYRINAADEYLQTGEVSGTFIYAYRATGATTGISVKWSSDGSTWNETGSFADNSGDWQQNQTIDTTSLNSGNPVYLKFTRSGE